MAFQDIWLSDPGDVLFLGLTEPSRVDRCRSDLFDTLTSMFADWLEKIKRKNALNFSVFFI